MPLQETLVKFNWVDIVAVCVIVLSTYKGAKKGFIIEIFKLLAVVLSLSVSLHYFSKASDSLLEYFPQVGIIFSDLICFAVLAILSYLAVTAAREAIRRFIKTEAVSGLHKWGGLILGLARGALLASMLFISFYFLNVNYLKGSVSRSYIGSRLVSAGIKAYEFTFGGIVSKFVPDESLNKSIYEVLEEDRK
jgi:uncharacterized membrane protein required for colicin V production